MRRVCAIIVDAILQIVFLIKSCMRSPRQAYLCWLQN